MALLGAVVGGPERGGRQRSIGGRSVAEVRRLGEGGFASVWLVQDTATSESFALKKISCPDRKSFEKGLREAELLEWLPRHPNVVGFSGSGVCDGPSAQVKEVLLLLELCSGGHLLDLLESHSGRLTEEQVLGPFSDVAAGVAFLHGRSPPVQHRDLKVENVLLGADGRWKLCDFGSWSSDHIDPGALDKRGLADLEEEIERHTTLMYRPPEMVNFFKQFAISTQVDIWMLGCILFTLMFYRNPFQGESPLAITNARFEFPPPEAGRQPFSERLHDLVRWLLAQDPAHRPSAAELQRLLARFADERGEPLPLPRAVLERKEQHLRLYNPQACPAPAARPRRHKEERSAEEKAVRRSARHRERERGGAADSDGWPCAWGSASPQRSQPEPSVGSEWPPPASGAATGWADFGGAGWPDAPGPAGGLPAPPGPPPPQPGPPPAAPGWAAFGRHAADAGTWPFDAPPAGRSPRSAQASPRPGPAPGENLYADVWAALDAGAAGADGLPEARPSPRGVA